MLARRLAQLFTRNTLLQNLLPAYFSIKIQSLARTYFLKEFYATKVDNPYLPNKQWQRTLWGITFRSPILNAAGMFKNGEGYDIVANLGAGGYIGGTSTFMPRIGNIKKNIMHPVVILPKSHAAINFLGLPNLGNEILAQKILTNNKQQNCPIGWSTTASPESAQQKGLDDLVTSLWLLHDNPQIDFIEINESCPNTDNDDTNLTTRLQIIATKFLAKRQRNLPVIVKFSNDMLIKDLPHIVELLIKLNFDGITLGNSSKNYASLRPEIVSSEQKLFDYFTREFGGGISGKNLKKMSLQLGAEAVNIVRILSPNHEFHVIRCGGIESSEDLAEADNAGVSLNQWYTGFFENYLKFGPLVYKELLEDKS